MLRTVLPIPCSDVARHHCLRAEDAQDLCNRLGAQVPEGGVQVVVSTIHGAKGLEWPQVVLYDGGQAQGRDPRTPEEEQEAVRLRYVAVTRSTRDLVALLHRDCHPAYDRMFAPEVLGRIRRLEELFGEGPAGHLDETRVAADLAASAPVLRYLREFPAHLPPERRRRLDAVLGRDPGEDRPPSTPPRVRRIPLVGRPARPEAD
nr:3'-5' exonuclease [Deinococcus aestuarii]